MSALVKGIVSDTNLSRKANGGTEQMRSRLLSNIDKTILENIVIHFSRFEEKNYVQSIPNIYYCHDLPGDSATDVLKNEGYKRFSKIVFVSEWQRNKFIDFYLIPYSHTTIIENAIEPSYYGNRRPDNKINLIYHTTPHRGLQLLYPIFNQLSTEYDNLHLNVYSSFELYGWKERDAQYKPLFDLLKSHENITYFGSKPNSEIIEALSKSHLFLYPCIWQETSCIAMIEAIQSGCDIIHPNLGALTETAGNNTIVYDFTENNQEHMKRAYLKTKEYLDNKIIINKIPNRKHSISIFKNKWNALLKEILNER
jgi:glycosyltransferase involved in cell wall biosynthesis